MKTDNILKGLLVMYEDKLLRIDELEKSLLESEEELNIYLRNIEKLLLQTEKSKDFGNELIFNWKAGINYIKINECVYQFIYDDESFCIKYLQRIDIVNFAEKEVINEE